MSPKLPENAIQTDSGLVMLNGAPIGFIQDGVYYPANMKRASAAKIQRKVISQRLRRIEMENGVIAPILFQKEKVIHPEHGEYMDYQILRLRQETTPNGIPFPKELYLKKDGTPAQTIELEGEVFGYTTGGTRIKGEAALKQFIGGIQGSLDS